MGFEISGKIQSQRSTGALTATQATALISGHVSEDEFHILMSGGLFFLSPYPHITHISSSAFFSVSCLVVSRRVLLPLRRSYTRFMTVKNLRLAANLAPVAVSSPPPVLNKINPLT